MHGFQKSHIRNLLTVEPFCPFEFHYKDSSPYGIRIEDPRDVSFDGEIVVIRQKGSFTMLNLEMVWEIFVNGVEYDEFLRRRVPADERDVEKIRKFRAEHPMPGS